MPGGLDDERNGNRRALANCHDLPVGRGDSILTKRLLGANLVKGQFAFRDAIPSVSHATLLQDSLHLAVFAKCSMQRDEGEIDAGRQFEVWTLDIDFRHLRA